VLGNLKRQWRALRAGKPGHRFQDRFERSRKSGATQSLARRLIQPVAAIVLLAIAVVLTFIPGPAIVFYFAAAGLLAGESRALARGLDWGEIQLRKAFRWLKAWWKRASLVSKMAVGLVSVSGVMGVGYAAYHVILAR
jgi:hypothetical protein